MIQGIEIDNLPRLENKELTYFNFDNWLTIFFKNYLRENALLRRFPSFWLQYKLMRPLHRQIFPFNFIRKGDTCVQAGCAEWMLDFGVSMSLIMSAIVGKDGRVIVIEPDQRNIDALIKYAKKHKIQNITIVKKAAWSDTKINQFTFYDDQSGSNVITEVEENSSWKNLPKYQGRPKRVEAIEMDTLDNIVHELKIKPDFVNLTINGAEFGVIKGMPRLLAQGVKVAWLFGNRSWWRDCIDFFHDKDYDVLVADSAYSHRAPTVNGRARTHSYRKYNSLFDLMYAVSVPKLNREIDKREVPGTLSKQKDYKFIFKNH